MKQSLAKSKKVEQNQTNSKKNPCMTVEKDAKLNRAKCLSVCKFAKFKVIELLTQLQN